MDIVLHGIRYNKQFSKEFLPTKDGEELVDTEADYSITKDCGTYIHNRLFLFDIEQTTSKLKTFKELKKYIRSFNKPVYIRNVIDEFKQLVLHVQDKSVRMER